MFLCLSSVKSLFSLLAQAERLNSQKQLAAETFKDQEEFSDLDASARVSSNSKVGR